MDLLFWRLPVAIADPPLDLVEHLVLKTVVDIVVDGPLLLIVSIKLLLGLKHEI